MAGHQGTGYVQREGKEIDPEKILELIPEPIDNSFCGMANGLSTGAVEI